MTREVRFSFGCRRISLLSTIMTVAAKRERNVASAQALYYNILSSGPASRTDADIPAERRRLDSPVNPFAETSCAAFGPERIRAIL